MAKAYFLHQIKHTNNVYDKGIVVKEQGTSEENFDAAKQSYHAYLGAYGYGHDASTDFVACYITNVDGTVVMSEIDNRLPLVEG